MQDAHKILSYDLIIHLKAYSGLERLQKIELGRSAIFGICSELVYQLFSVKRFGENLFYKYKTLSQKVRFTKY